MSILTTERFLKDVDGHQMTVVRDDGIYRHVRFKRPETICMHFDLITWPGYLCYTGDMGTYVFTRLRDMFEFFRRSHKEDLFRIDMRYWAEKVEAGDRCDGVKKFSFEKFEREIRDWVARREEESRPDEEDAKDLGLHAAAFAELLDAVKDEVLGCDDNDVRAYDAATEFEHRGEAWQAYFGEKAYFAFSDFWEVDSTEWSHRFVWCCFALAWGIKQYDELKAHVGAAEGDEVPA